MKQGTRWLTVVVFGIAMAWMESAVVFYLRTLSERIEPFQKEPLPAVAGLALVEVVREAATLIMLFTMGMLAGRTWRSRWGYAAIAFGVWDIFYYVFLKVITGWPHALMDWDILFLLPLPWWGPVLAPVLIALLMIVWGTLATQWEHRLDCPFRTEWKAWLFNFAGMLLALYVFMKDAIRVVGKGEEAVRAMLPTPFDWPVFLIALVLMSSPVLALLYRMWRSNLSVNAHSLKEQSNEKLA